MFGIQQGFIFFFIRHLLLFFNSYTSFLAMVLFVDTSLKFVFQSNYPLLSSLIFLSLAIIYEGDLPDIPTSLFHILCEYAIMFRLIEPNLLNNFFCFSQISKKEQTRQDSNHGPPFPIESSNARELDSPI